MDWPTPISLHGTRVSIVPLVLTHLEGLQRAAADGDISRLWYTVAPAPETMAANIEQRLRQRQAGSMLPFTVIEQGAGETAGQIAGMTTYLNIDAANKRLEIGATWYRKSVQRTGLNTECKYLLLKHAFEDLACIAVEFRTHYLNQQSRRAIERLGAKFDGILRAHMVMPNGTVRDTAVYSVIASEWPTVKANLVWLMDRVGT